MRKLTIKMSYTGDKIEGQGVGAATKEQINLIKERCQDEFDVLVNQSGKHDILHVHTIDPVSFFRMMTTKAKIVMHVHFLPETLEGSIKLPKFMMGLFHKYFLYMYRKADYIVVVNPIFIEPLVGYNIKRENIKYIPNFVSEEVFYETDEDQRLATRREFKVPEDKFVVLGVGQVQTRKGVIDFVEVAKRMPDLFFVWAGGFSFGAITDGYKELKAVVENPPANVIFTDIVPRTKMNDIYNMADVLFMPSFNELFPMAILEACSSKRPLLLRNLELYEDILFNEYYQAPGVDGFVDELTKLSEDKGYYTKGVAQSDVITQYYSRNNIKKEWVSFYIDVYQSK